MESTHIVQAHVPPSLVWCLPFVVILLSIALLPLLPKASHWWEHNKNKLLVSVLLATVVCAYYVLRPGEHSGIEALGYVLDHAILRDYIPFIILLFSLYTISGGVRLSGDIPAHPLTNTGFLALGAILASVVGTTGASMLLIRPLLQINAERHHVKHTVIFFIFMVSNIGGSLLPIGDPPLFLGYLRGVPFLWTLHLLPLWALSIGILLVVYFVWDVLAYRHEAKRDIYWDETVRIPLALEGKRNFILLAGVVAVVALLVPGRVLPIVGWTVPNAHLSEICLLLLTGLSWLWTSKVIHAENEFNFGPIAEVACLFIGIFITMQVPIEILRAQGAELGITTPMQFFWATGILSSFLDNAPTYVVFFELAGTLPENGGALLHGVATGTGTIPLHTLLAISAGAVFMGANTYIGNGPNFLVKSIAERQEIKMPSFFGYMLYSGAILIPVFILVALIFFRG